MKYINGKELMMFLQPPITKLSVFEAETIDAALCMCAEAFKKLEKTCAITIDFPTFKYQLLKTLGEFLNRCEEIAHVGLVNPRQRMTDDVYVVMGVELQQWPKQLQKKNAENYFIIQYALAYANILKRYLMDCGLPTEFCHHLANEAALKLADWITNNCIKKCEYECIRRNQSHGYCTLCSFMIHPLACPKKQEISYQQVMCEKDEIQCKRELFPKE